MKKYVVLTVLHIILGFVIANYRTLSFPFGLIVLTAASTHIIYTRNQFNQAAYWAAYIVGLEVLLRMTGGFLVYEAGKYSIVFLLSLGLLVERIPRAQPLPVFVYGLLLLPSFAVVDFPDFLHFRRDVSFNLSGPLSLIISTFYFYKRVQNFETIVSVLRLIVIPLISVVVYLMLVTPELSEIEYGTQSNFQASAGFGPNQISIVMGLGIFIIGLTIYFGNTVTGYLATDLVLMVSLLVRGLATFSRGGMIGGVAALLLLILLSFIFSNRVVYWPKALAYSLGGFLVILLSWNYVNEVSEKKLEYRYQGINYRTGQTKEITSGRLLILEHELNLFRENLVLGVGPGMVREIAIRANYIANTHSEYSRTLAEHGLFGVCALLILIFFPINFALKQPQYIYPISFALLFLVYFTMFHSAMRLAMPGFLYGLIFFYPGKPLVAAAVWKRKS